MENIFAYKTLIFDCDGVVLNSNKIKSIAFYEVAKSYGYQAAKALKLFHIQNGGISRYAKFEYFLTQILNKPINHNELNCLLDDFAGIVKQNLLTCEISHELDKLRMFSQHTNWMIVSGGDQAEIREVFAQRGLDKLFESGIFGSPDSKDTILARELSNKTISKPALFLGDSKYDYLAASKAGLDFVFVSQWTEVADWSEWTTKHNITCVNNLLEIAIL